MSKEAPVYPDRDSMLSEELRGARSECSPSVFLNEDKQLAGQPERKPSEVKAR